jgi:hypothetical protein
MSQQAKSKISRSESSYFVAHTVALSRRKNVPILRKHHNELVLRSSADIQITDRQNVNKMTETIDFI